MMMKDDNREASWELMKFLSSKENSRKFCEDAGYISPREDAVAESTLWLDDPILSVYTEQLKLAKARGLIRNGLRFPVRFSLRTRMCSRVPNQWTMH